MSPLLLCTIFSLLSITRAQDRSPHGLDHASPTAFSPSAFEFFHPDSSQPSTQNPCAASGCTPFSIAASVHSTMAHESKSTSSVSRGGSQIGTGGLIGIVPALAFAALLVMGAYYVVAQNRANKRENVSVQAEV